MKYDPATPIAVFLGPSLDGALARAVLAANYYPPVRLGDVYRLIASGVRLIVIIDGVFHRSTPVWQREILAAIRHGITVVGASSMGALRAVELEPFGMIGVGTIVEWYRRGLIDGDDEVALQHAEGEFGYRALSEPLVNVRWNVARAHEAGVIDAGDAVAVVAWMQARDYTSRSYAALLAGEVCAAWPPGRRDAFRTFVTERGENLKAADARAALAWCVEQWPRLAGEPGAGSAPARRTLERAEELLMRGVLTAAGDLVPVSSVLPRVLAAPARVAGIVLHAARRFYVLDWADRHGIEPPAGHTAAHEAEWAARHRVAGRGPWHAANAITPAELSRALAERAREAWLLDRGPRAFGLDRPFLEAWADEMGIDRPAEVRGGDAFRAWLVEKMPPYFGFDHWSVDVELVRELQVTGELAVVTEETASAGAGAR